MSLMFFSMALEPLPAPVDRDELASAIDDEQAASWKCERKSLPSGRFPRGSVPQLHAPSFSNESFVFQI